jgi:hypothetical protein
MNLKSVVAALIASAALVTACGKADFNGNNQTDSVTEAARYLNSLPRSGGLHIHFDEVDSAKLVEIAIMLGMPCYIDPASGSAVCPPGGIFSQDEIAGKGYVSPSPLPPGPQPLASSMALPHLNILVSYDPKIDSVDPTTNSTCLAEAQRALANHLTLDIFGTSTIWPVPVVGSGSAGPLASVSSDGTYTPAPVSSSVALPPAPIPQPPFVINSVGVTLSSIGSCLAH